MFHVVPQNDEQEHFCQGTSCPCGPRVQLDDGSGEMICVHRAFDCREVLEEAARIMNSARAGSTSGEGEKKRIEVTDKQLAEGENFNATHGDVAIGTMQVKGTLEGVQTAMARMESALRPKPAPSRTANGVFLAAIIGLLFWGGILLTLFIFR